MGTDRSLGEMAAGRPAEASLFDAVVQQVRRGELSRAAKTAKPSGRRFWKPKVCSGRSGQLQSLSQFHCRMESGLRLIVARVKENQMGPSFLDLVPFIAEVADDKRRRDKQ